jgi:hypothetical protein
VIYPARVSFEKLARAHDAGIFFPPAGSLSIFLVAQRSQSGGYEKLFRREESTGCVLSVDGKLKGDFWWLPDVRFGKFKNVTGRKRACPIR